MKIGEKIKKLRTEKMMTQTELAGNVITRNMLSCIENGTAMPSLATLTHIASKLNIPAGYLLSDGDDELIYLKMEEMQNIKNAYLSANYKICRDMCINTKIQRDDEINLIFSECSLALGVEKFNAGKLRNACEFFDEAIELSSRTVYDTSHIKARAAVYFRYMRNISPTLSSNIIDEEEERVYAAMGDEFSRYAIAFEAIEEENYSLESYVLSMIEDNSPYKLHINAKLLMKESKFEQAYQNLYMILTNPYKIQEPLMYHVFCDLESCCRERGDFKGAYEYSNDKIEVLQKMLTEI